VEEKLTYFEVKRWMTLLIKYLDTLKSDNIIGMLALLETNIFFRYSRYL